jgi:TPR repeat protein
MATMTDLMIPFPSRTLDTVLRVVGRPLLFGALACAFSIAAGTAARADFEAGWQAFQQGDFATAKAEWQPLAEQGNARAQFNLGVIYDEGRGVERSRAKAIEWWSKAADQNLAVAQHNLAMMQIDTPDGQPDIEGAVKWLERSLYTLGRIYADGVGVPEDDDKAFALLLAAGQGGLDRAQYDLAEMYRDGRGVAADQSRAAEWFRRAAMQGYAKAQNKLSIIYAKGRGVEADPVEALKWAILAAREGNREAENNREILAQRLSSDQIVLAEQQADNFAPRIGPRSPGDAP